MKKYFLLCLWLSLYSCYSFQGINLPPEVSTFNVVAFENEASYIIPGQEQTFTNDLLNRIRNDTRLKYVPDNADVEFSGKIIGISVSPEAPSGDSDFASQNRFTVSIQVEYVDNTNEKNNWNKQFTQFENFPVADNLLDVQDQLLEEIHTILIDDIFKAAFTDNW